MVAETLATGWNMKVFVVMILVLPPPDAFATAASRWLPASCRWSDTPRRWNGPSLALVIGRRVDWPGSGPPSVDVLNLFRCALNRRGRSRSIRASGSGAEAPCMRASSERRHSIRRLLMILAFGVLLPATARAEPIVILRNHRPASSSAGQSPPGARFDHLDRS